MSAPDEPQTDHTGDYLDERGVLITAAGRARWRKKLDELDAYWTPERRAEAHAAFLARLNNTT